VHIAQTSSISIARRRRMIMNHPHFFWRPEARGLEEGSTTRLTTKTTEWHHRSAGYARQEAVAARKLG